MSRHSLSFANRRVVLTMGVVFAVLSTFLLLRAPSAGADTSGNQNENQCEQQVQIESLRLHVTTIDNQPSPCPSPSPSPTLIPATAVQPTVQPSVCLNGVAVPSYYDVPNVTDVIYEVNNITVNNTRRSGSDPATETLIASAAADHVLTNGQFAPTMVFLPLATGCDTVSATVDKTNNADGIDGFATNENAPAPDQAVQFKLTVTNTSTFASIDVGEVVSDAVRLNSLEAAPEVLSPSCLPAITNLAAEASASCFFTLQHYSPADGDVKYDQATVTFTRSAPPLQLSSLHRLKAAIFVAPLTATSGTSSVTTKVAKTPVTAVAPTVIPSTCVNGSATAPSYTVPVTPGVIYSPAVGGTGVAGGSTTVTATAAPGFVLSNPNAATFTVVFGPAASCAPPPVVVVPSPAPPDNDLGVSKTGPGSAHPGDELVYTIDVTNVRGTSATGFTVTDVVPAGLAISSAEGRDFACSIAGQKITCTYGGSLAVGAKASIVVRALLDTFTGTSVANTAVVDPGRSDSDASNNSSTATTTVVPLPVTGDTGGPAEAPSPAASPSPAPVAGGDGGGALPFTGLSSESLLQGGVALLLLGLFLALVARRRRLFSS